MFRRLSGNVAAAAAFLCLACVSASAGEITGYNTALQVFHETYDRFLGPFPGMPTMNTTSNFLLNGFTTDPGVGRNLSGIGWATNNPGAAISLVSPQHVIGAYHVFQGNTFLPGSSISFVNRAGEVKTYQLSNAQPFRPTTTFTNGMGQPQTLPSDVYVGTLAAPIDPADLVDYFPIVNAPANAFTGRQIYAYGQNVSYINPQTGTYSPHVGTNNVDANGILSFDPGGVPVNEATAAYVYDWNPSVPNEIHLIQGDSGGPSMMQLGNQLALIGAHYGLDPQSLTSADSFFPFYINQINSSMMSNTPFSLSLVAIPEPSTLALTVSAAGLWLVRRRRMCIRSVEGTTAA